MVRLQRGDLAEESEARVIAAVDIQWGSIGATGPCSWNGRPTAVEAYAYAAIQAGAGDSCDSCDVNSPGRRGACKNYSGSVSGAQYQPHQGDSQTQPDCDGKASAGTHSSGTDHALANYSSAHRSRSLNEDAIRGGISLVSLGP